jgi:hypothetical protein
MTTQQLQEKIFNHQITLTNELHKKYWTNISISINTIKFAIENFDFNNEPDGEKAIGFAKLTIMELWTIRELLECIGLSVETDYDIRLPNLKNLRDAYAHIKERIQGIEKPRGQPRQTLVWETRSIANGKMTSIDGVTWNANCIRLFNLDINGAFGAMLIFGLVDNFLVCNSSNGLLEIELDINLLTDIINITDSKI